VTDRERGKLRALSVEKDVLANNQPANPQSRILTKAASNSLSALAFKTCSCKPSRSAAACVFSPGSPHWGWSD